MSTKVFINLPVKDLKRSVDFFSKLGYSFDQRFTDQNATCMVISDTIFVMLLVQPFFQEFTKKAIPDTAKSCEVIIALSANDRNQVDSLIKKAMAAGASSSQPIKDQGWMYSGGFQDLDGHLWEIAYMDETAAAAMAN